MKSPFTNNKATKSLRPGTGDLPTPENLEKLTAVLELLGLSPKTLEKPSPSIEDANWADLLVGAQLKHLIRRIPLPANKNRPAEHCPYTGLNRGQFYEAIKPRRDGRPYIRTISMKEEGERHGARFYYVRSALDYMKFLANEQESESEESITDEGGDHGQHS
jgi:hypothetical protein